MKSDIETILQALPGEVAWEDVVDFEHIDERVAAANYLYGDIIGVSEGVIEWCPNNNPPDITERLAWWWVIRPDLAAAIIEEAPSEFQEIIANYIVEQYTQQ